MKRETLYASLVGCASFCLIAYGSFWYFSPAERVDNSTMERGSPPGKAIGANPAAGNEPAPLPEKPAATDNATPAAAGPLRPTPTAYGTIADPGHPQAAPSSNAAGRSPVETDTLEDAGTRQKFGARGKAAQMRNERQGVQREGRKKRKLAEDD